MNFEAQLAEWNAHDAYFTAVPIVQQLLQSHAAAGMHPERIVDVGAGAGPFAMVARQLWPQARIVAVEIRSSERRHLRRWADHVVIADAVDEQTRLRSFRPDLVMGNLPYKRALLLSALCVALRAPDTLLLHRGNFGDSDDADDWLRDESPDLHAPIGGRPKWRPEMVSGDNQRHVWFRWRAAARRAARIRHTPRFSTVLLPRLPSSLLTWTTRPGTELEPPPLLDHELLGRVPWSA